jgi:predicted porin
MTISIKNLGDNLMKKALLPLLIASLIPASAFADVTVYGKAWLSFQQDDLLNQTPGKSATFTEVRNNESRLGVKGSEAVTDDVKVIYQYELKIGADGDAISASNQSPIATRNIFIGLQSNFGTVKVGNFDTPLKLAQEKTDVFKDMIGDWKNVFKGEVRAKNSLQYSTPAFQHVTVNVDYVSAEAYKQGATQNGYSTSVVYDTKPLYLALANDHDIENSQGSVANLAAATTTWYKNTNIIRAVGRVTFGPVVLGAMYQTYDNGVADVKGNVKKDGAMVSAIYNIDDKWAVKGQYGSSDQVAIGGETTSIGVDYKLSKNTKVTGYYSTLKDDGYNTKTKLYDATVMHDDKWIGAALELTF